MYICLHTYKPHIDIHTTDCMWTQPLRKRAAPCKDVQVWVCVMCVCAHIYACMDTYMYAYHFSYMCCSCMTHAIARGTA